MLELALSSPSPFHFSLLRCHFGPLFHLVASVCVCLCVFSFSPAHSTPLAAWASVHLAAQNVTGIVFPLATQSRPPCHILRHYTGKSKRLSSVKTLFELNAMPEKERAGKKRRSDRGRSKGESFSCENEKRRKIVSQ